MRKDKPTTLLLLQLLLSYSNLSRESVLNNQQLSSIEIICYSTIQPRNVAGNKRIEKCGIGISCITRRGLGDLEFGKIRWKALVVDSKSSSWG